MKIWIAIGAAAVLTTAAAASDESWQVIKPSNTGIPGEEVRQVRFDPQGNLWVTARWPFWGEGGLARWNKDENTWTVWSNWETPIGSPYINDIAFDDANGVIWIATGSGLVRMGGYKGGQPQWTVYTTANAPFLHDTIMNLDLDPTSSGSILWINNSNVTTVNGAIFRVDVSDTNNPQWTMFTINNGLPWAPPWGALSDVIVDPQGTVWVGNQTLNGLAKYNAASNTWTLYGGDVGRFGRLMADNAGHIWLRAGIGGGNAFWKFNTTTNAFTYYPAQTTPTAMGLDDDGAVYLGDWNGLVRKTTNGGASWTTFANIGASVFNIGCDPRSTDVWLGSPGAARHHDGNGAWIKSFNTYNTGLPEYFIDRFQLDPLGNMWFSTGAAGLSRYEPSTDQWRNWSVKNAGSEPYPFAGNTPMGAFFLDSQGSGWMGGNGIARWNPQTGQFTGFWNWQNNPGMGVTLFTSFAEDAAGNLFAASRYGEVMRFNGTQWVTQPPGPGGYTSFYAGVKTDHLGRVWSIGNLSAWLWDGDVWTQVGQAWDLWALDGANAYDLAPDGTLWIGATEGLLRVKDPPHGEFTLFTHLNSPLPAKQVQGVSVRSDGLIGVSAYTNTPTVPYPSGVALIDGDPTNPENWTAYAWGEPGVELTHYQLGEVIFDADGRLWISCISEGVAILTPPSTTPHTPGDLNGDGVVDVSDLLILLSNWGPCPGGGECPADLNGDGSVDVSDLLILLANWG